MRETVFFNLLAILAMVPSTLLPWRRQSARDAFFWAVLGVAVAAPVVWVAYKVAGSWQTDVSTALWVTIGASMVLFAGTALLTKEAWRLTSLFTPYMVLLGILATVWGQSAGRPLTEAAASGWIGIHIVVSVATYGLVTIAAVAGLAAVLQERAFKAKRPTRLSRMLPSVADCDWLMIRLLTLSVIVLALGLISGMALQFGEGGRLLVFDHKTILTVTAFLVIGGLLIANVRTGLRGRKAARFVLLAYLLLTLGYPGVKFVTDVILA